MILPFVALLAMIAIGPLLFPKWWGKNYPKVAAGLAAITLGYYLFGFQGELPKGHGISFYGAVWDWLWAHSAAHETILEKLHEYISFIALIGSLYVVSGGIHINVKGEATPRLNVLFLLIGAVLANLLGTTGASMLLIRPWLRMNKYRVTTHHVVFFIFIVSNVGGCLTPIGDPPLFLGYLKGIPFLWVLEYCWPMWVVGVAILLLIFYVVDRRNYLRAPKPVREHLSAHEDWRFDGLANIPFLLVILFSVFINNPPFLREGLMLAAAVGSYFTTKKTVHESNHFNFHPIQEVAILFIGIFMTMMPALDWLSNNAANILGKAPATQLFFWGSGILSSVLDNAPTYLSFLTAIFGSLVDPNIISQVQHLAQNGGADLASASEPARYTFEALQKYFAAHLSNKTLTRENIEIAYLLGNLDLNKYIVAISIGSVFFGANTYIGNGPNFMVKSIADHQKVHSPHFLEYIFKWTLPVMLPMLLIVWWIFFRG